jgi:hypothetical protein
VIVIVIAGFAERSGDRDPASPSDRVIVTRLRRIG